MPPRCSAAVLDLGNVLVEVDYRRTLQAWAHAAAVPVEAFAGRFSIDEAYCGHERGEIDDRQYMKILGETLGLPLSPEQMLDGWNVMFGPPFPDAGRVVRELAARMPVYVFSNTNPAHVAYFSPRLRDLLSPVTRVITSCDIGARKPEPEAFRRVAAIAGLPPAQLAFFDDLEENVEGARRAGLHAHRVTHPEQILEKI